MTNSLGPIISRFQTALKPLKKYHRHTTVGVDNVPLKGPAIIVLSHAMATYDTFLPAIDIYRERGRVPTGLADDLIFKIPLIGTWARQAHLHPASPKTAAQLLDRGALLYIAPGGMKDGLRPSTQKRQLDWSRRKGFIRLSIRTGAPIIPCVCPAADDIFTVYENPITPLIYSRFKLPATPFRGLGPTLLPRPIKLTHHVTAPMVPPEYDEATFDAQVDAFHGLVCAHIDEVMQNCD